jgi:hypothetical protein
MWNHKVEDWGHLQFKQNYQNQIDYLVVNYLTIDYLNANSFIVDSFAINIEAIQKMRICTLYMSTCMFQVPLG